MAANTKKMRLGTCVTNPAVRDVTVSASLFATLNLARRGAWNWHRARRQLPPSAGEKTHHTRKPRGIVRIFRNLNAGKTVDLDGVPTKFPWTMAKFPASGSPATAPRPCAPRDASATA